MTCEEFILARETGGVLRRLLVRHHAARCPRCAAEAARLDAAKEALAWAQPLTRRQRMLWMQAAGSLPASPHRRGPVIAGLGAACAAVALLLLFLHKSPPNQIANGSVTVVVYDPQVELDRLAADCQRLDADIERLLQEADRRDAQRQVTMALNRFSKW